MIDELAGKVIRCRFLFNDQGIKSNLMTSVLRVRMNGRTSLHEKCTWTKRVEHQFHKTVCKDEQTGTWCASSKHQFHKNWGISASSSEVISFPPPCPLWKEVLKNMKTAWCSSKSIVKIYEDGKKVPSYGVAPALFPPTATTNHGRFHSLIFAGAEPPQRTRCYLPSCHDRKWQQQEYQADGWVDCDGILTESNSPRVTQVW